MNPLSQFRPRRHETTAQEMRDTREHRLDRMERDLAERERAVAERERRAQEQEQRDRDARRNERAIHELRRAEDGIVDEIGGSVAGTPATRASARDIIRADAIRRGELDYAAEPVVKPTREQARAAKEILAADKLRRGELDDE
jgi:hypothetical protein